MWFRSLRIGPHGAVLRKQFASLHQERDTIRGAWLRTHVRMWMQENHSQRWYADPLHMRLHAQSVTQLELAQIVARAVCLHALRVTSATRRTQRHSQRGALQKQPVRLSTRCTRDACRDKVSWSASVASLLVLCSATLRGQRRPDNVRTWFLPQ